MNCLRVRALLSRPVNKGDSRRASELSSKNLWRALMGHEIHPGVAAMVMVILFQNRSVLEAGRVSKM